MIKKLAACLFFLLCSTHSQLGYSGDGMGNGGGLAEANIALVYHQLESYISLCLEVTNCSQSDNDSRLLNAVGQSMAAENAAHHPQFKSEIKEPDFFRNQQGFVMVFRTDTAVGDPVFFNLDLIYRKDPIRGVQAVTVAEATQIVFMAFANHHAGILDAAQVEALARRLKDVIGGQIRQFYLNNMVAPGAGLEMLPSGGAFPQIIINDAEDLFDITAPLQSALMTELKKFSLGSLNNPMSIGFYWDSCIMVSRLCMANLTYRVKRDDSQTVECRQKYLTAFTYDFATSVTHFQPENSYVEKTICAH